MSIRTLLFVVYCGVGTASAAPLTLSHQGRLLDVTGAPIQGTHSVNLALYDGAANNLWSDDFDGVSFQDGYFSVVLGSGAVLQQEVFARDTVLLGMALDYGSELPARQQLHSVPFAAKAAGVQLSNVTVCGAEQEGTLRWTGSAVEVCDGSGWSSVGTNDRLTQQACEDSGGTWGTSAVDAGGCDWLFASPASYTWTVPLGVNSIAVVAVGAGGGGGASYWAGGGGGGGALAYRNAIDVVPGQQYTVVVGLGGTSLSAASGGVGGSGGSSSFSGNAVSFGAGGGTGGTGTSSTTNTPYPGGSGRAPFGSFTGGSTGGAGGTSSNDTAGGGGGAGGYSGSGAAASGGNGGNGGNGGGGGGGAGGNNSAAGAAQSGGGVGLYGLGATGSSGAGGSGGTAGSANATEGGPANRGGSYGGGGSGQSNDSRSTPGCYGGNGAVRIIWGADLRDFPSTAVGAP
jgi:hypothetical protein